jgi:lipopolysaccharide export system permease protein
VKKIHSLVLRSFIGPLVFTFLISLFVLLMQFLWKWVEDFVGKGLDWTIIGEILFYASAGLVPMALPLAVLLASVMTFGNMGEYYELTAAKASGISLLQVMKPLIILTIFISMGAFFFSNNVLPYTNLKIARLLFDVNRKRPELNIRTGVFNNDIEGYSIRVKEKNRNTLMMYDFMIYDHSKHLGNQEVTLADSGFLRITGDKKYMVATLFNGRTYVEMQEDNARSKSDLPHRTDIFDKQTIIFELTGFDFKESRESLFRSNYQMMNLDQLSGTIDSLMQAYKSRQSDYPKRLKKFNYFKIEPKVVSTRDSLKAVEDSVRKYAPPQKLQPNIDTDSIFVTLTAKEKKQAIQIALEESVRLQNSIESTNKSMGDRLQWIRKHQIEWYRKFSLSFACLIFFFIGAPLGAIIRKGGFGMPFLVSIILFMFYYVISIMGEKFAREEVLPVFVGSWLSSAVLFPLGVFVTYKATKDSAIMNKEAYIDFFSKLAKRLRISKFLK